MPKDLTHASEAVRRRNPDLFSDKPTKQVGKGMLKALAYRIEGRPVSTKNSRALGNGRSFMSKAARDALRDAQAQLRALHPGPPLPGCYDMTVTVNYSNRRSWLDSDNVLNFCGDLVKGVLVPDDKPAHLRDWTCRPRLKTSTRDHFYIELWEVPT